MANALYDTFKESLMDEGHDLEADTLKMALIDSSYTYSASHSQLSDFSSAIVGTAVTMTNVAVSGKNVDCDDVAFTGVTGNTVVGFIIYNDTHADDAPIAYFDTGISGFPVTTPSSADITIQINASGLFDL